MKDRRVSLKWKKRVGEGCALLMQFLLYHALACTALTVIYGAEQPQSYVRMLFLLLPLCYLAWVRTYVKNFILFMVMHIPAGFTLLLIRQNMVAESAVVLVCTLILVILVIMLVSSVHVGTVGRKTQTAEKYRVNVCPHSALALVLLCGYGVGYYGSYPMLKTMSSYELQLYVILYLVHENMENTLDFIHLHRDTANVPIGQMTIINRLMLCLFLLVEGLTMVIVPKLHLEIWLQPLLKGLLALLSWLLSKVKLPEAAEQVEHAASQMGGNPLAGLTDGAATGTFWILLEQVMKLMAGIVCVVLVVGGIGYLLYHLYKGFYSGKKEDNDEKEFLVEDMKWFSRDWFSKRKKESEENGTVNQKIRKAYRRYVKKSFKRRESVPAAMTPEELLETLREKSGKLSEAECRRACEIYEQARYGQPECRQEELDEIRHLLTRNG